eukprot:GGOE01059003.1.p1 GENE.GGOE01059003.1~~GGOE01059003.1.p1  ORF type:complete len:983 (+),score=248.20 GGOE01059003.1:135-3083(+)
MLLGYGDDAVAITSVPRSRRSCRPRTSLHRALQSGQAQTYRPPDPHPRVNPEMPYAAETWSVGWGQGLFSDWLRTYKEEKALYSSETVWVEQALVQLRRATSQLPQPNTLQTTTCCFLLLKLCASLGAHCWDLLKRLCGEVFRAVFIDWEEVAQQLSAASSPHSVDLEALFAGRHTFADALRAERDTHKEEVLHRQSSHEQRVNALLQSHAAYEEEFSGWRQFALKAYFARWRNHALRKHVTRVAVDHLCRRYRNLSEHFIKEKVWLQWKFFHSCCKRRNTVDQVEKEMLRARTTVANAELSCRELRSQAQQKRQEFDHVVIDLHAFYREEVSQCSQFSALLEADVLQLLDDNSRLLDQLADFKRQAHRWATLAQEMARSLRRTGTVVHPIDLLRDPTEQPQHPPAELLSSPTGVEEVLMRWVNVHLYSASHQDGVMKIENFGADLRDGRVYTALVSHVFPELPRGAQHPLDAHGLLRSTMETLRRVGIPHVLDIRDVISGDSMKNALFVSSLLNYFAMSRWMRLGEGCTALAEPFSASGSALASSEGGWDLSESPEDQEYRNHVAAEEYAIAQAKEAVALITDDEMWTAEQGKIREMARRLWNYRRPRERQRTQRELERRPIPSDWQPEAVGSDFQQRLYASRAWMYLGQWCQAELMARVARLRIADDETIRLLDRRRDQEMASMLTSPTLSDEAAAGHGRAGDKTLLAVSQVVHQHFDALLRIYRYYAAMDDGVQLTYNGFRQLCKDVGVTAELRGRQVEFLFFPRTTQSPVGKRLCSPKRSSPTRTISSVPPSQFLACLLHVAVTRYGGHPRAALTRLVEVDLLPNARQCDPDQLKSAIRLLPVQEVLRKNEAALRRAFTFYASAAAGDAASRMTLADFQQQLTDAKLLGPVLSMADVHIIFAVAQDEYVGNVSSSQPTTLSFHEWIDGVVCVALYRHPQPFLPVAQRVAAFLEQQFFPGLSALQSGVPDRRTWEAIAV